VKTGSIEIFRLTIHTPRNTGNCLGLPISKGIVELLGGNIWLDLIENKGTTVKFTITEVTSV